MVGSSNAIDPSGPSHDVGAVRGVLRPIYWTRRTRGVVAIALLIAIAVFGWLAWDAYNREFKSEPVSSWFGAGGSFNGFDVSNATVKDEEIRRGGPPRDGIPAILHPKFVDAADVVYLRDSDEVLGFVHGGESRAYPLRILVWHEIANDTVGGVPIAATYCPLCGTCMVFDRRVDGDTLTFGVSGLLYQSDVLMYDHQTESLWSQLKTQSISGEHVGQSLKWLDSRQMTWAAWKKAYPNSEVLSPDTGYSRNYGREAYASYKSTDRVLFPVPETRTELAAKEWVVGILVNGQAKAYPIVALDKRKEPLMDSVGNQSIKVAFDADAKHAQVTGTNGTEIPCVKVYWFAWQAFYPDTLLYAP